MCCDPPAEWHTRLPSVQHGMRFRTTARCFLTFSSSLYVIHVSASAKSSQSSLMCVCVCVCVSFFYLQVDVVFPAGTVACKPSVLSRLTAPSPTSIFNVTLAGQTFDGSLDGKIIGTPTAETVTPTQPDCKFTFTLPSPSAAMLVVSSS